MVKIAPSLLAANFANLEKEIRDIEDGGASWLHYDVMDGHFVPNISFGYSILKDLSKVTNLFLDVHLMISDPMFYVDEFIKAGAHLIVFHVEAMASSSACFEFIKYCHDRDVQVGISIKPATPVEAIKDYLSMVDVVLVMSVEPGFGGQTFNPSAVDKIAQLNELRKTNEYTYLIEVDGGINAQTAPLCNDAGVDVLVAGSSVFSSDNYKEAIALLK